MPLFNRIVDTDSYGLGSFQILFLISLWLNTLYFRSTDFDGLDPTGSKFAKWNNAIFPLQGTPIQATKDFVTLIIDAKHLQMVQNFKGLSRCNVDSEIFLGGPANIMVGPTSQYPNRLIFDKSGWSCECRRNWCT